MPLIHIDDRIRYVRGLRDQGLLKGIDAGGYLERLILNYAQFPIPEEYTTTHYVPAPDGSPRLMARGHLLLTVRPEENIARFDEPPVHPVKRILHVMGREKRLFAEALTVRFPYGAPFGNPFNRWLQTRVLREALGLLEQAREPNTIVASRYRWRQSRERVAW
ncbi:MAG TPA: hypothetical protein VGF69_11080 [Thermoanaerobaculia bacterium]|jgi:hypothetical protein